MGFYLPDTNQIRIRISYRAYETILQDISEFQNIPQKEQISSFLNRMLKSFWTEAESTIAENKPKIYQKYLAWLTDSGQAEETALNLTEKELKANREHIRQLYAQPKKANGQNFKLIMTKSTREFLEKSQENELYEENVADYLAALIQEYTVLPREERERIFFKDIYQKITHCIKEQHQAEITIQNKNYLIKPFQIATNGFLPYYYIIGYAHLKDSGLFSEEKLLSFRLQRIQSAEEKEEISYTFTNFQKSELKTLLKMPVKMTYLAGEEEKILIRLTENGYRLYRHVILSGRPAYLEKTPVPDGGVQLTFFCTKEQIYQYFIRLGKEAEILAPSDLRERFADLHQTAVQYYNMPINFSI